jgi:L-methionine (R)-S-oxide reductase
MSSQSHEFEKIRHDVDYIISQSRSKQEILQKICELLHARVPYYHWIGFYLIDPNVKNELVLGPYVGEPTEHTRIPFGKGICGQAAERRETVLVQDVTQESNYLACSPVVKSEIVVPIFKKGKVVGELDIDSHKLAPFTQFDQDLLECICAKLSSDVL